MRTALFGTSLASPCLRLHKRDTLFLASPVRCAGSITDVGRELNREQPIAPNPYEVKSVRPEKIAEVVDSVLPYRVIRLPATLDGRLEPAIKPLSTLAFGGAIRTGTPPQLLQSALATYLERGGRAVSIVPGYEREVLDELVHQTMINSLDPDGLLTFLPLSYTELAHGELVSQRPDDAVIALQADASKRQAMLKAQASADARHRAGDQKQGKAQGAGQGQGQRGEDSKGGDGAGVADDVSSILDALPARRSSTLGPKSAFELVKAEEAKAKRSSPEELAAASLLAVREQEAAQDQRRSILEEPVAVAEGENVNERTRHKVHASPALLR